MPLFADTRTLKIGSDGRKSDARLSSIRERQQLLEQLPRGRHAPPLGDRGNSRRRCLQSIPPAPRVFYPRENCPGHGRATLATRNRMFPDSKLTSFRRLESAADRSARSRAHFRAVWRFHPVGRKVLSREMRCTCVVCEEVFEDSHVVDIEFVSAKFTSADIERLCR